MSTNLLSPGKQGLMGIWEANYTYSRISGQEAINFIKGQEKQIHSRHLYAKEQGTALKTHTHFFNLKHSPGVYTVITK